MFDPWVGKMPWRRAWQSTPVFLPGDSRWIEELGGLQSTVSQRVDMSDRLSTAQLSSLPPWTQTHTPTMVFSPVVLILFPGLLDSLMPIVLSRALMSCTHYLPQAPPLPCTLVLTRTVNSTRTCLLHVQSPFPHTVLCKPTHHCPLLTFANGLLYPLELWFS